MGIWTEKGMFVLIVVSISITSWMPTARIVRADVLALKEENLSNAKANGTSDTLIILRHIMPNVLSPIMVSATLGIANGIITEMHYPFGLRISPDFPLGNFKRCG